MKTSLILTLAAIGFSFGPRYLMAEPATPTNPADHGTNVTANPKAGTGTGTKAESGTTGKTDATSPADHGNNTGTTGKKVESTDTTAADTTGTDKPETKKMHKGKHKKPQGDDTNPGAPVTPTKPDDHGNNTTSTKTGTGTGTAPSTTGNSSTGTPNTADHGNNTGKGTNTATEKK